MVLANKNSLVKKETNQKFSVFLNQNNIRAMIANTIKDGKGFVSAITSAVGANPTLQECTNESIFAAALLGASLNLPPSPQLGYFYMVPFNDKKSGKKKAQFQLGYKGLIQLALRTGQYKNLIVSEIKDGELMSWNPITEDLQVEPILNEVQREQQPTIGYYAKFELINGFTKQMFWSREKMEKHADEYSKAFNLADYRKLKEGKIPAVDLWKFSSFWYENFDAMALKTMLRQIIGKFGPMTTELAQAFDSDERSLNLEGKAEEIIEAETVPVEQPKRAVADEAAQQRGQNEPPQEAQVLDDNANTTQQQDDDPFL